MLTLREDWRHALGGVIAADLVAQVPRKRMRNVAASCLIGASLDLLTATWPRKGQRPLQVETLSDIVWRIKGLYYMFLPDDDDTALSKCIELAESSTLTVVLLPDHESLKQRLLLGALGGQAPNVWSLKGFISWRTTSAAIDQGWPHERAITELLALYNRRAQSTRRGDVMLVDIP